MTKRRQRSSEKKQTLVHYQRTVLLFQEKYCKKLTKGPAAHNKYKESHPKQQGKFSRRIEILEKELHFTYYPKMFLVLDKVQVSALFRTLCLRSWTKPNQPTNHTEV